jgi:hypothetical protein
MKIKLAPDVWYDSDTKGYIMLELPNTHVVPIVYEGVMLEPKREHHCSIVAARKLAGGLPDVESRIVEIVREQLAREPVQFTGFRREVYVCHKPNDEGEEQTTVVVGVDVTGLAGLQNALQTEFPQYHAPFPHATVLKSANSPYGIGVNSAEDLTALCERHDELFAEIFPNA